MAEALSSKAATKAAHQERHGHDSWPALFKDLPGVSALDAVAEWWLDDGQSVEREVNTFNERTGRLSSGWI